VFASIPGAVPAATVVIVVPMLPAGSFNVILTGNAAASETSLSPSFIGL